MVHASLMRDVSNVEVGHKATGLGGVVGNKGAVAVSLRLRDTALCFVNAHLAARPERVEERNSNFAGVCRVKLLEYRLSLSRDTVASTGWL